MKRTLLSIIVLLFIHTARSQTSIYHQFPDSSATWNFHLEVFCVGGYLYEDYSMTISGDTIINNLTYHKLNIPYVQNTIIGFCTNFLTPGYQGALREDVGLKKMYFIAPTKTTEQMLYDFNLQVGDTVNGYIDSLNFQKDTVSAIDSVLVGNDYRKRWTINSCYNIYIIEGVGSTYGLIRFTPPCLPDFEGITLVCFTQNQITLYPDTNVQCPVITGTEALPLQTPFALYPNPFSEMLNVDIQKLKNEKIEIKIYDLIGRTFLTQYLTNGNLDSGQERYQLQTRSFPSGIYIYEISDKNSILKMGKLIKE